MSDVKVTFVAVDGASEALRKIASSVKEVGSQSEKSQQQVATFGQNLMQIAGALGIQMGLQAIVGGLKNIITHSFELAAALETSKMAFGTMLGSAEAANKMLADLRSFADSTPFEFMGLQAAAKRMMAYGFAAEEVIPTLRNLGDAAGALGGGTAMIDRLTLALGQMKAKGKVSGEELMQLSETGIPALKFLADAAGVTTAEMSAMVSKGIVPADQAIKVLLQGMEKNFGGLMAKQAETATGKISTLKDAISELQTVTGEGLVPVVIKLADVFTGVTKSLTLHQSNMNTNARVTDELALALERGYISAEQFGNAVEYVGLEASTDGVVLFDYTVTNMAYALELATEAQKKHEYQVSISHETLMKQRAHVEKVSESLDMMKKAVDPAKEALRQLNETIQEQTALMSLIGGATKDQEQDQIKNTETIKKTEDAIAKLTTNYRNNQAAVLAGKGTIVDNTLAIEKANIAADRAAIQFGKLNERFANQEGIDAFNQGMGEIDEALRDLNTENAKGEMSAEKFATATKRLSDKQDTLRERFDKSKMSQQDFDLSVREHNVNLTEASTRMTNLTAEHGKGYTAAELAAQGTSTYNTKLATLQIELQKAKERDIELQTQVATRIKEGILLEEIALAAKDKFTDAEILMLDTAAEALGIADSEAIIGAINTGIAATDLAKLRETYAADFVTQNKDGMVAFGVAVDSIGKDITEKLRPSMEDAENAAKDALVQLKLFSDTYNGLNSKDITLTYHEVRVKDEVILQNQAMAAAGVAVSEPGMAAKVNVATGGGGGTKSTAGTIGAHATGGPIGGMGGAYLVGEYGPELFDPSGTGRIFSANQLGRSKGNANASGNMRIDTINMYGVQNPAEMYEAIIKEARSRGKHIVMS